MPNSLSPTRRLSYAVAAALLLALCLAGCATQASGTGGSHVRSRPPAADLTEFPETAEIRTHPLIPVVPYGRYTLVELSPGVEQQDLMQQIVDVTMPPTLATTVGDALRYVLLRSGFELCRSPEIRLLDELPLPAADFHLGPLTLEGTLRILVGPGWNLEVDEVTRKICFTPLSAPSPAGKPASFAPMAIRDTSPAARPMPASPEGRP